MPGIVLEHVPENIDQSSDFNMLVQAGLKFQGFSGLNYEKDSSEIHIHYAVPDSAQKSFDFFSSNEKPKLTQGTYRVRLMEEETKAAEETVKPKKTPKKSAAKRNSAANPSPGPTLRTRAKKIKTDEEQQQNQEEINLYGDLNINNENIDPSNNAEEPKTNGNTAATKSNQEEELDFFQDESVKGDFNAEESVSTKEPEAQIHETTMPESEKQKNGLLDSSREGSVDKKSRNRDTISPSKVVHVRNLPETYHKNDFVKLLLHYGHISHCIFMKSQAFVQMSRQEDATNMIKYTQKYPMVYENRKIYLQYSEHQELRKNESHDKNNRIIENMISYIWNEFLPHERPYVGCSVIICTVENMQYPIDLDTIHQIYCKYGRVLKIRMMLPPDGTFKALVQMENPMVARTAANATNERSIYSDANFLRAKIIHMFDLIIGPNEKNAVDFTRNPNADLKSFNSSSLMDRSSRSMNGSHDLSSSRHETSGMSSKARVILVSKIPGTEANVEDTITDLFTLFATVGVVDRIKVFFKAIDRAFIEFKSASHAQNAISLMNNVPFKGGRLYITEARIENLTIKSTDNPRYCREFFESGKNRFTGRGERHLSNIFPPSNKLHLSNIHGNTRKEDLIDMFAKYGRVQSVQVLERSFMAFVEMDSVESAVAALLALHGLKIKELTLTVSFAKKN